MFQQMMPQVAPQVAAVAPAMMQAVPQMPAQMMAMPAPQPQSLGVAVYDALQLPPSIPCDPSVFADFKALAAKHALPAEAAQQLLSFYCALVERQQQAHQSNVDQWVQQVQDDRELGGGSHQQVLGYAKQALQTFGSPELMSALDESGLGNHPAVVRAFYRIGKAMAEDGRMLSRQPGGADPLRALYPSMFKD